MITVGAADDKMGMIWGKFEEGAREVGKDPAARPKMLQIHISWAPTEEEAIENAMVEWPNGGMAFFPKQDIKNPEDFEGIAKLVRPEDFKNRVLISRATWRCTRSTSSTTSTWASTRSTSTTSGATRPSSSRSSGKEVIPNLRLG